MNKVDNQRDIDTYIRLDRMPHIWCPGCGLGSVLHCFIRGMIKSGIPSDKVAMVSGIGCTGRAAGYVQMDSFHTTHGRAIPFATGLKLAKPELKVVVFSGDGDLVSIGGNHFIHAARRNMDLTVVLVNNFTYGMTGGQFGPTTPTGARTATSREGNVEPPFNVPHLAAAAGATYVARWTLLHARQFVAAVAEAMLKPGFSVVEVISPCPTVYGRLNTQPSGLDQMKYYHDNSIIQHGANPRDAGIELNGQIIVGKFVDIQRPVFADSRKNTGVESKPDAKVAAGAS